MATGISDCSDDSESKVWLYMCSLGKRLTVPNLSFQTRSSVRECLSPLKMKDDNSALFRMLSHVSFLAHQNMMRTHFFSDTWLHPLWLPCRDLTPAYVWVMASHLQSVGFGSRNWRMQVIQSRVCVSLMSSVVSQLQV